MTATPSRNAGDVARARADVLRREHADLLRAQLALFRLTRP
jgi:hypothetical protein